MTNLNIEVNGIAYVIDGKFAKDQIRKLGKDEAIAFWNKVYNDTKEKLKAKLIKILIEEIKSADKYGKNSPKNHL